MFIEKAVLQYQLLDGEQNIMDFYHTGVPESQRGKGIAGQLVRVKLNANICNEYSTLGWRSYFLNIHSSLLKSCR